MDRDPPATVTRILRGIFPVFLFVLGALDAGAQVMVTKGTNFAIDVSPDGRIAMDLMGEIWTLPARGGQATSVVAGEHRARRPRWSPDGGSIVYESENKLWRYELADGIASNFSVGNYVDRQPDWHPDGRRIVYSSYRRNSGLDLWEVDLPTRLTWRITHQAGDESEPAWSTSGRDLVYIHHLDGAWSLMLRRLGQPDRTLVTSSERLSSPSWRPDGSLVTFLRHGDSGYSIEMAILSEPLLVRPIVTGEDFFVAPAVWANRQRMLYTSNGVIRTRAFNSWSSKTLPFHAWVRPVESRQHKLPSNRKLPPVEAPTGQLVVRTARLFDGTGGSYREGLDIVIDGGTISAVEAPRERPGAIVVDLGDLTALPGLIDVHASLPADTDPSLGPVLLSFGITTVVTDNADASGLDKLWAGKAMPGPRVLGAAWQSDLDSLATMFESSLSFEASPAGIRYEDVQIADNGQPNPVISELADSRTAGVGQLLRARQAKLLRRYAAHERKSGEKPQLGGQAPPIVVGSRANGLAPGIAQHAELRALAEAGLSPEKVFQAAGINAAKALGLGLQTGRIAPGASADLIIVDGDPLADVNDAANVVGVVRNGRFYSAIGLIERVDKPDNVE